MCMYRVISLKYTFYIFYIYKIYKAHTDRYIKINRQKHMKVENINTPISVTDRLSRDKTSRNIVELNITIKWYLETLYQPKAEYTFFSSIQEMLIKIHDMLKNFSV